MDEAGCFEGLTAVTRFVWARTCLGLCCRLSERDALAHACCPPHLQTSSQKLDSLAPVTPPVIARRGSGGSDSGHLHSNRSSLSSFSSSEGGTRRLRFVQRATSDAADIGHLTFSTTVVDDEPADDIWANGGKPSNVNPPALRTELQGERLMLGCAS